MIRKITIPSLLALAATGIAHAAMPPAKRVHTEKVQEAPESHRLNKKYNACIDWRMTFRAAAKLDKYLRSSVVTTKSLLNLDENAKAILTAHDKDVRGRTPLHRAVMNGEAAVVAALLEGDACVESKDNNGWTPLGYAFITSKNDIVAMLIAHGADVNARDNDGWTLLHHVILRNLPPHFVTTLRGHGIDVNSKDRRGWTPLHCAAIKGLTKIADLLIQYGADIAATDNAGKTPLDMAVRGTNTECAALLYEAAQKAINRE